MNCPIDPFINIFTKSLIKEEENYYKHSLEFVLIHLKHSILNKKKSTTIKSIINGKCSMFKSQFNNSTDDVRTENILIKAASCGITCVCKSRYIQPGCHADEFMRYLLKVEGKLVYHDSPHLIRLMNIFPNRKQDSFWFAFEFWICCLDDYFQIFNVTKTFLADKYYQNECNINLFLKNHFKSQYKIDLDRLMLIYSFELLSAANYLAEQYIVHGNLNSQNVLIDARGHLKIADVDLEARFKWMERSTNETVHICSGDSCDKIGKYLDAEETISYGDDESLLCLYQFLESNHSSLYANLSGTEISRQNFASDAYAVGVLILQIHMAGFTFTEHYRVPSCITDRFKMHGLSQITRQRAWSIFVTYDSSLVKHLLTLLRDEQFSDFISLFFKPRSNRLLYISKKKYIKLSDQLMCSAHIDITKVEKLDFFKNMNITNETVRYSYIDNKYLQRLITPGDDKKNIDDEHCSHNLNNNYQIYNFDPLSDIYEYS